MQPHHAYAFNFSLKSNSSQQVPHQRAPWKWGTFNRRSACNVYRPLLQRPSSWSDSDDHRRKSTSTLKRTFWRLGEKYKLRKMRVKLKKKQKNFWAHCQCDRKFLQLFNHHPSCCFFFVATVANDICNQPFSEWASMSASSSLLRHYRGFHAIHLFYASLRRDRKKSVFENTTVINGIDTIGIATSFGSSSISYHYSMFRWSPWSCVPTMDNLCGLSCWSLLSAFIGNLGPIMMIIAEHCGGSFKAPEDNNQRAGSKPMLICYWNSTYLNIFVLVVYLGWTDHFLLEPKLSLYMST